MVTILIAFAVIVFSMAKLYTRKKFIAGASYHIFNRGNNRSAIFFSEADFLFFRQAANKALIKVEGEVETQVFALMPNHYHLLVKQKTERAISKFMRSTICAYAKYMNRKYQREGTLFNGIYCAKLLTTAAEITAVRKYILANPAEAGLVGWRHVGLHI